MRIYVFFRELGDSLVYYPIALENDAEVIKNAEINPGTIKVERLNGEHVWPVIQ